MRKYDESMPTPTDFSYLKLKVGLVFTVLMFPVLFYYSILALAVDDPELLPVRAKVRSFAEFGGQTFMQVEPWRNYNFSGTETLICNPDDRARYSYGQEVLIARNPRPTKANARYEYVLYDDYRRMLKAHRVMQCCVVTLPFALLVYFWYRRQKRMKKPNPFTADSDIS